jgi:hypothetical protein
LLAIYFAFHHLIFQKVSLDKLFGPSSEVYVTRDQLSDIAIEMYTSLNIVEEYEMPMYQFNENFIEGLISQVSESTFKQVAFDEAIQPLSKYSTNFDNDLKADIIKEDFGKIYQLKKINDKKFIKTDKEHLNKLKVKYSKKGSGSLKGIFGMQAKGSGEIEDENESLASGKS